MSLNIPTQQLLSEGTKWFAYSGIVQGDVSVPASITLIDIPNTGLRDSYVCISPSYARAITNTNGTQLGITIAIDDIVVVNSQRYEQESDYVEEHKLFVPRQSKLTITSLHNM